MLAGTSPSSLAGTVLPTAEYLLLPIMPGMLPYVGSSPVPVIGTSSGLFFLFCFFFRKNTSKNTPTPRPAAPKIRPMIRSLSPCERSPLGGVTLSFGGVGGLVGVPVSEGVLLLGEETGWTIGLALGCKGPGLATGGSGVGMLLIIGGPAYLESMIRGVY